MAYLSIVQKFFELPFWYLDSDDIASVVEDTIDDEENETTARKTKSAKAITDLMLGLMDFRIGNMP